MIPRLSQLRRAAALIIVAHAARAQVAALPGELVKNYKLDFAIPDAPAFKLLEVDESAILRPQTVRDISAAFDAFRGQNGSFVVPKQIGVEFSPALLIGNRYLKLSDYQTQRFLYATRLSAATSRDSLNRGQLATGIRFSMKDEQDLRARGAEGTDTLLTRLTKSMADVYSKARDHSGRPPAPIVTNSDEDKILEALRDTVKAYWTDHYWNANSLEIAFAGRASTTDSLGHDPKFDSFGAWGTYANGIGGWGQLLIGAKMGTARDSSGKFHASNTLALRLYLGSNVLKAFVEFQNAIDSKTEAQFLGNSGVELKLSSFGWVNASAGVASTPNGDKPHLISSFKFKTGIPGLP
jgi:hypothetical protein